MKVPWKLGSIAILVAFVLGGCTRTVPDSTSAQAPESADGVQIVLPEPRLKSDVSLEETLLERRSVRQYSGEGLKLAEVSQLLWAAQGITAEWGGRTAPSAGGLYPLEVYVVISNVETLSNGAYRYDPVEHRLTSVRDGDITVELARAALDQEWVREAAMNIIIAAVYERTTEKYGDRGVRYVHLEAGHAAQNIYLQATALDLGVVTIGAFHDEQVQEVAGIPENEEPLYVIPVGRKM